MQEMLDTTRQSFIFYNRKTTWKKGKKERKEVPLEVRIIYFVRYKMVLHVFKNKIIQNHSLKDIQMSGTCF